MFRGHTRKGKVSEVYEAGGENRRREAERLPFLPFGVRNTTSLRVVPSENGISADISAAGQLCIDTKARLAAKCGAIVTSSASIRSQIAALEKKKAGLEADRAKHVKAAGAAAKAASEKSAQALRTRSASSQRTYSNAAAAQTKKHAEEAGKAAVLSGKIADLGKQVATKLKTLHSAETTERRQAETIRRADDAKADKRRKVERDHAREISRLSRVEVRHVIIEAPKPELLRVLYLTSSPDLSRPLRVDAEVSAVQRAIEAAKYRHSMDVSYFPAPTPGDFVDRINSKRPHIVHFSGHGEKGVLMFDNGSFSDPSPVPMTFDELASFLSATDTPPKLLVMNACKSLEGAELLLEAAPILIAMEGSIDDAGAAIFAAQFYSAIANGQPVGHAFRQGRAAISFALMSENEAELPHILCRQDVDPDSVSLIADRSLSD